MRAVHKAKLRETMYACRRSKRGPRTHRVPRRRFTLYDVELQKPVPTVAKLVGESKEHTCIAIEEAARAAREDVRRRIQIAQDRVASGRLAASNVRLQGA